MMQNQGGPTLRQPMNMQNRFEISKFERNCTKIELKRDVKSNFLAPANLIKIFDSNVQIGPKTASKNVFSRFNFFHQFL